MPRWRKPRRAGERWNRSKLNLDTGKKRIYFVLDYINRGSLFHLIKLHGNFPEDVAAMFTRQTCEGLKYLHSKNIIHRDIKCANLLLTQEGILKLADFGTAKEDAGKNFTVIGTPYWMAPEIIEVAGAHVSSDIWSLGCTLVEMLRGTPPYFELVTMQALFKIVEDPHPPIPSSFSEDVQNFLIKQCFVKDPKKRASAESLLKLTWIKQLSDRTYNYTEICAMFPNSNNKTDDKKEKKTVATKTNNTNGSKISPNSSRGNTEGGNCSSGPKTVEELEAVIKVVQKERDMLAVENVKLKKELQSILGHS